jgi:hypothetical protein
MAVFFRFLTSLRRLIFVAYPLAQRPVRRTGMMGSRFGVWPAIVGESSSAHPALSSYLNDVPAYFGKSGHPQYSRIDSFIFGRRCY